MLCLLWFFQLNSWIGLCKAFVSLDFLFWLMVSFQNGYWLNVDSDKDVPCFLFYSFSIQNFCPKLLSKAHWILVLKSHPMQKGFLIYYMRMMSWYLLKQILIKLLVIFYQIIVLSLVKKLTLKNLWFYAPRRWIKGKIKEDCKSKWIQTCSRVKLSWTPFCYDNKNTSDFQILIKHSMDKLNSWGSKFLSLIGNVTLINSSLLSLRSYFITHSLVPKKIFDDLDKLRRNFLWHNDNGK